MRSNDIIYEILNHVEADDWDNDWLIIYFDNGSVEACVEYGVFKILNTEKDAVIDIPVEAITDDIFQKILKRIKEESDIAAMLNNN